MICSISGIIPEEPVVSMKTGFLFERRLIEKLIQGTGKCPINNENLTPNDLLAVKNSKCPKPRIALAASIPGMLELFHNEWDALILENHQLKKQLTINTQELANALYQHDAACRVITRLLRERNDAMNALITLKPRPQISVEKRLDEDSIEN